MKHLSIPLRAVFYRESDSWIAHCLEFDVVGDGVTKDEAIENLSEAIRLQVELSIEHDNPANLFTPADGKYFRMFAEGHKSDVAVGVLERQSIASVTIEELEAREYSDADPECALA